MTQPVTSHCPICGSDQSQEWYRSDLKDPSEVSFSYSFSPAHSKIFRVLRCLGCTHAYCSPIPDNINAHYRDVVDEEYLKHSESRKASARAVLKSIQKELPTATRPGAPRLLDVGCATGDLLSVAREMGFQAEGLELSRWSSEIARGRGFQVHEMLLSQFAATQAGTYDVITLLGVIEHLSKPLEELRSIQRLLKPGGVLALWTGDVDSITSRLMRKKWWYWQGQHIQYFTHASMKRASAGCGLKHVTTLTYPFAATQGTLDNSLKRYSLMGRPISRAIQPLFKIKPIWFLRLPGEMLFIARKPA